MSKNVLGAFSATLRASLGFAQSILFRRPLVPRFIKFLVKALPGDNVWFARVRLRHNNRTKDRFPIVVPRFIKFLVKALPGDNVWFARVRLRHNNREPVLSPSLR